MEEEMGTIIFNGKMYNLSEMSEQELAELEKEMKKEERKFKHKIDKELN